MPQPHLSPNGHAPRFVLVDQYVRRACTVPGLEMVQVEIRSTLTNGEVEVYQRAWDALVDAQKAIWSEAERFAKAADEEKAAAETVLRDVKASPVEKAAAREALRASGETRGEGMRLVDSAYEETRAMLLERLAPHARSWNIGTTDNQDAPPPAEAGIDAFRHASRAIEDWLIAEFRTLTSGKALTPTSSETSTSSPPTAAPTSGRKRPRGATS